MIPVWAVKMVGNRIFKAIKHNRELKKIDDYVNKPNEIDIQMKQQQKTISKQGKTTEEHDKDIAIMKNEIASLKEIAHAPQEYMCCKNCGCKINKIKKNKEK